MVEFWEREGMDRSPPFQICAQSRWCLLRKGKARIRQKRGGAWRAL